MQYMRKNKKVDRNIVNKTNVGWQKLEKYQTDMEKFS